MLNQIIHGDCLEVMSLIPSGSVDMILCDLPYGTTSCSWDVIIPFEPLWKEYERIIKDNGAIVLTASQPFTTLLIQSNMKLFRYEWIWEKTKPTNFLKAKSMPLRSHENICVFSKKQPNYVPQGTVPVNIKNGRKNKVARGVYESRESHKADYVQTVGNYPRSIIKFKNGEKTEHQSQKPVDLFEYLIRTYTREGETVLDNCMGSGTTAEAAISCKRNFIGIEKELKFVTMSRSRIQTVQPVMNF